MTIDFDMPLRGNYKYFTVQGSNSPCLKKLRHGICDVTILMTIAFQKMPMNMIGKLETFYCAGPKLFVVNVLNQIEFRSVLSFMTCLHLKPATVSLYRD